MIIKRLCVSVLRGENPADLRSDHGRASAVSAGFGLFQDPLMNFEGPIVVAKLLMLVGDFVTQHRDQNLVLKLLSDRQGSLQVGQRLLVIVLSFVDEGQVREDIGRPSSVVTLFIQLQGLLSVVKSLSLIAESAIGITETLQRQ